MFGIKQISLTHSGDWVSRIRNSGRNKTCQHTRYYQQAAAYLNQRMAQFDLERADLLGTHTVEVIPDTMYEGFTNYSTWLAATVCDNNRELYDVVHEGLNQVARRYKCGDPQGSSYPFITTAQRAPEWTKRLRVYVGESKGIDVRVDMTALLTTTFIYNHILPFVNKFITTEDDGYPDFKSREVCTEELTDHFLSMYFDKVYQEVHYARERR